ncbi:hypothetical protein VFPPC_18605 [Pochonia chlamydosporia 170]|uniref:Uncharacterized protein n=1 Tax=Pochonia chlamydosporia 170 TaxID=1380566 RepID=A0A219ANI4_METCM|nr:hypothetical protein VFPPC_18605 [Pochonia chlamydosporia 170]OWT42313.1 hypothetical protein VFPPC_18605 [Pochonia chlamydosporia 170]
MEGPHELQELLASHGNEKMLAAAPAGSAKAFDETQLIGISAPATTHLPGVSELVNGEASEQLEVNCDVHWDDYWQIATPGPAYVLWWYAYTAAMSSRFGQ